MEAKIILDGDGAFPELAEDIEAGRLSKGTVTAFSALPGGMSSGRPSVGLIAECEDGTKVFVETSLRLFQLAAAGFTGKYGDHTDGVYLEVTGLGEFKLKLPS